MLDIYIKINWLWVIIVWILEEKIMSDENVKWIKIEDKLVKQMLQRKEKEYGSFNNNSYIVANYIQSELEMINGIKIKVPIDIVPRLMIVLKLTRTINDGTKKQIYKEDTHSDILGYNDLLKTMLIQAEKRIDE
tara:strand:- start:254 stop:655 length:402 start_codon:yes stop_codon:yes gene_type:complete